MGGDIPDPAAHPGDDMPRLQGGKDGVMTERKEAAMGEQQDAPGQRTTPEIREALRQQYTPEPEPTCEICDSAMAYRDTYGDGSQRWDCTVNSRHPQFCSWRVTGDANVLALCEDADALAGALAEVGQLRDALAFYADLSNYFIRRPEQHDQATFQEAEIAMDRGKRAREALAPQFAANTVLDAPRMPASGAKGAKSGRATAPATGAAEAS
jgi:hypothetical protein